MARFVSAVPAMNLASLLPSGSGHLHPAIEKLDERIGQINPEEYLEGV